MNALQIQSQFSQNVCNGFMLYCKNHNISVNALFKVKGKLTRQSVYAVIQGKKPYLTIIALCYLPALLGLKSPSELELYYENNKDIIPDNFRISFKVNLPANIA